MGGPHKRGAKNRPIYRYTDRCTRTTPALTGVMATSWNPTLAVLLAAIVIAFAGAFFSLSQDIRVSATGYEMDRLAIDQQRLQAQADDLRNELNRLGKAPAIRKFAIDAGLGPLPEPEIIAAR